MHGTQFNRFPDPILSKELLSLLEEGLGDTGGQVFAYCGDLLTIDIRKGDSSITAGAFRSTQGTVEYTVHPQNLHLHSLEEFIGIPLDFSLLHFAKWVLMS